MLRVRAISAPGECVYATHTDVMTRVEGMAQLARDGINDTLANLWRVAGSATGASG